MVNELMDVTVQIGAVRFRGNGTIFVGHIIDEYSVQTGEEIMIRCPGNILYPREEVFRGEIWKVSGYKEIYKGQPQLGATKAILKRPEGKNIIAAIAFNPKFEGIGEKKARDLWAAFGEDLYGILDADEPDIAALQHILTSEATERLLRVWRTEYSGDLYRWMDEHHFPLALGRRLQEYYGKDARDEIEKDPYRVLAFGQSWSRVDAMARSLGVAEDDPRRLHAAVAEVLYRHFAKGHTAMLTDALTMHVTRLLGTSDREKGQGLAFYALKTTYVDGAFVLTGDFWQATGVYLLEAFVANRIRSMIASKNVGQGSLLDGIVQQTIDNYEETDHGLNDEQKAAIRLVLESNFSIITGGAGVGKTTVLRCIYNAIETTGGCILQMALSGKAAKRMEDASGHPAQTIAGFLTNIGQEELEKVTHAVIDEASMLDIVSAFRILQKLPERVNLILIGDPYQLPPIGAGLTFHVLADADDIPISRLTKVYRQSCESGIPTISNAIRNGEWPRIPQYCGQKDGVFCYHSGPHNILDRLMEIYEELGGVDENEQVQILSAIKADNAFGVVGINKAFHIRYTEGENLVLVPSPAGDLKDSGFRQGDKIIVTKNQWEQRLFNGSLGYITEAFKTPVPLDDSRYAVAKAFIDGREICLAQDDLDWIMHSYSISVHKAQGSQFKRVIVPICKSRLLDRTLIYTAVTRGIDQVVLLGDLTAAKSAVEAPPHAWLRQIGFRTMMHRNAAMSV